MAIKDWLEISLTIQCVFAVAVLVLMTRKKAAQVFPYLVANVATELASCALALALLYFRRFLHLDARHGYVVWFVASWILSVLTVVLRIMVVYGVFAEAMRPMAGLHQAGKIIFRWVGVVSLLVALALLAGPGTFSGFDAFRTIVSRLQQGVSVLTLCLLVFVCFAARPLGLTFRSYLFGASVGLGIAASVELIQAAWVLTSGAQTLYSPISLFSSLGFCVALLAWGVYFALPEPPRKMILLPTTSPFFFWNRISEILGDAPGHVAVAGFTPDMLAPAEIEMLTASTSVDMQEVEEEEPVLASSPLPPSLIERPSLSLDDLGVGARPSLAL